MKSKVNPPTYFYAFLFLCLLLHFLVPIKKVIPHPYNYLGLTLIVFGTVINIWTDSLFKKSNTTVKPYENPTSLEVEGPFRISRHPMYLGMAATLLGLALLLGSLITVVFPFCFVLLMEILFIPVEEKNLQSIFGDEYMSYRRRVRRWL